MATTAFRALHFNVIEIDNIKLWTARTAKFHVGDDIGAMDRTLTPEKPIAFETKSRIG